MTTKIQDLKKQSLTLTQSHNTLKWELKDDVSGLLAVIKRKQDEIKTALSYLDADTVSQIQLDAKKIFVKTFKETHSEVIDDYKAVWTLKRQIREEKNQILEAMSSLHQQALEQWLTDLWKEQFIRMLTMTQAEIKYNFYVKEDALLQNIADVMKTDRDQIDLLRKNFNDGSNYPEDPLSSLETLDSMVSNAVNMWFLKPNENNIMAMNKSQINFLLASCRQTNWIYMVELDGHDTTLDLTLFDREIKWANFLVLNNISRMDIEHLEYIEQACRTHQLEQSDEYKKICPTNKMVITIQDECMGNDVWDDRKAIILNLLKNTQELVISEKHINDLYWNITTLLEQLPNIRNIIISHTYDEEFMRSYEQRDEIKKKWFSSDEIEKKWFTFSITEKTFVLEKIE